MFLCADTQLSRVMAEWLWQTDGTTQPPAKHRLCCECRDFTDVCIKSLLWFFSCDNVIYQTSDLLKCTPLGNLKKHKIIIIVNCSPFQKKINWTRWKWNKCVLLNSSASNQQYWLQRCSPPTTTIMWIKVWQCRDMSRRRWLECGVTQYVTSKVLEKRWPLVITVSRWQVNAGIYALIVVHPD